MHSKTETLFSVLFRTTFLALIPMIGGAIIVHAFYDATLWQNHLLHTFIESAGGIIGIVLAISLSVLITKAKLPANYTWLVGSFVGMCVLDISHALVDVGIEFVWLHSLATFVGGMLAMLVWLPERYSRQLSPISLGIASFTVFTLVSLYSILFPEQLPPMLNEDGDFSFYAKFLNLTGGLGFLISWLHFAISYFKRSQVEDFYLSNQVCFFGLAGMLFQLSVLWDGNWWLWHMLRAMAILLLAFYFLSQFYAEVRKLERDNRSVNETTQSIFESLVDGLIILDSDSRIIQFSSAAEEILGYRAENIRQHRLEIMDPTSEKTHIRTDIFTVLNEAASTSELSIKHQLGYFVSTDIYTSIWERRNHSFVVLIIRPNKKRKQREAKMRLADATMDNTQDMVFWIVPESGRIEYVNQEAVKALGYDSGELVSKRITDIDDVVTDDLWDGFQQVLQQDGKRLFESVHKRKDGSTFPVSVSATLVKHEKSHYFVCLVRDISEQKQTEHELMEAKEEAEAASNAKADFLANMSHEIRTPMNAVIGLSQLALQTELSAKQRGYLKKIHLSAENLLGIINDILDISKVDAGKLEVEHISFDLSNVINNIADIIAVKASDKDLELLIAIAPEVPSLLKGDPLRLSQILLNLANNAIKFTDHGEIRIAIDVVNHSGKSVSLSFTVKDTGIGISQEQQKDLFTVFSQADTSVSRRFGGTGLGLSISKKLANLMDGAIEVESELGQGAEFTLVIPFDLASESEPKFNQVLPSELIDKRVLVVDDHPATREIITHYATMFGLKTQQAGSGDEAVTKVCVQGEHFDLILMDWKMPGINGLEAVRLIREQYSQEIQPLIIMVTAYSRDELSEECTKYGVVDFLPKPVTPSALHDAILDAFGRGAQQNEQNTSFIPEYDSLKGAKILLVDDNDINLSIAKELLELGGMVVETANNGQRAIECLYAEPDFDGVLMDIHMPVMDGYSATRELRQEPRFHSLPVIAMTANAMLSDREKAIEAGMNDHVAKPIDTNKMYAVLAKWISVSPNSSEFEPDKDLKKLLSLLEDGDTGAIEFVRSFQSSFPQEWQDELTKLIDDLKFDEARSYIQNSK
ncbi:response regulator [Photobacterium satsumensis]|uniref:response regulator n=1 Tax=Photobacterium satsumensis TaxID=2910239 RepID=UPI003D0FBFFA